MFFKYYKTIIYGVASWLAGTQQLSMPASPAVQRSSGNATHGCLPADSAARLPVAVAFGKTPAGEAVLLYTLQNHHGMRAMISTYGGTLTGLLVPDRYGRLGNVVLGFDSLADYLAVHPYFGATVGRYANRIAQGRFSVDGHPFQLSLNKPPNAMHGGNRGFSRRVWTPTPSLSPDGPALLLSYVSPDGEEGYPGTLHVQVRYTLTEGNGLRIDYSATTNKPTILNLTNHSYFNLNYGQSPDILGHELVILANRFTPVNEALIPTGFLQPVKGTPFDFRQPHLIGERIDQVSGTAPGGYDHNYVLATKQRTQPVKVAQGYEPLSGRVLTLYTDQPGVQFYSGNSLKGTIIGKNSIIYGPHAGFCLETQHFPDSPNHPRFPSTLVRPGKPFSSTTEYRFSVRK